MKTMKITVISVLVGFMLCMASRVALAVATGTVNTSKESIQKIQTFVDDLKKKSPVVKEICVYAALSSGSTMRIVSTVPSKIGKPADPEDIDAITENKVIAIDEGGVLDVTVPMVNAKGQPSAVAGIRIFLKDGMTQASAKEKAISMAKDIEKILDKN